MVYFLVPGMGLGPSKMILFIRKYYLVFSREKTNLTKSQGRKGHRKVYFLSFILLPKST